MRIFERLRGLRHPRRLRITIGEADLADLMSGKTIMVAGHGFRRTEHVDLRLADIGFPAMRQCLTEAMRRASYPNLQMAGKRQ